MGVRSRLISFFCFILAVTLLGYWASPGERETVIIVEQVDASVFDRTTFKGFSKGEEALLREALLPKFTVQCTQAFHDAGLRSPWERAWESGIVFQYSRDLYVKRAADLGLVYTETRDLYQSEFSTGRAQAGTIPHSRNGTVLTTDGKPHILIHDSAFYGESFWLGTLSLADVLTHELLHACGQPPTPGWLGFIRHDLAGFEHYEQIIEACR